MLNDQYGAMRRKEPSERERLLEAALDQIPYGVQIYDQDAHIVFFNRASKEQLLGVPLDQTLQGQALLDVFAVRPDYSTTMTALRRGKAMNRRFDRYKSTIGVELNTITSAYPVAGEDGETLGCVTFERNLKMTKRLLETGQQDQQTLLEAPAGGGALWPQHPVYPGRPHRLLPRTGGGQGTGPEDGRPGQQHPHPGGDGHGKEIFAQGIHNLSLRRRQKFVAVNCAAFPETLIEGMLFGTVKGAFTGSTDKVGLMEEANHGTLFLDELNSMSLGMQAKLLRALQERLIQRIGGTGYIPIGRAGHRLLQRGRLCVKRDGEAAQRPVLPPGLCRHRHPAPAGAAERPEGAGVALCPGAPGHGRPAGGRDPPRLLGAAGEALLAGQRAGAVSHHGLCPQRVGGGRAHRGRSSPGYFLRLQQSRPEFPPAAEREEIAPASSHSFNQLVQNYQRRLILQAYQASGENVTRRPSSWGSAARTCSII